MIRKIEIERFSLTTSKRFDQVIAGVNAAIGHPDMAEFGRSTHEARSFAQLKSAVEKGLSKVGLMLFMQLDHGAIMRKETGRQTPKMIRFVIGNPLIMKEMAKHVPDAREVDGPPDRWTATRRCRGKKQFIQSAIVTILGERPTQTRRRSPF